MPGLKAGRDLRWRLATAGAALLLAVVAGLAVAPTAAAAGKGGLVVAGKSVASLMAADGKRAVAMPKLPGDPGDFNGACTLGEFCLFYLSDNQGSVADFNFGVYDLNVLNAQGKGYPGPGVGQGNRISNNSMSAANAAPYYVIGCIAPAFTGVCGYAEPMTRGNFADPFYLNIESFYWYGF